MLKRVAITGGGSGGHIFPLVAVLQALIAGENEKLNFEFHYFGPRDKFAEILDRDGIKMHQVVSSKMRRYASGILGNILDIPKFFWGLTQALAGLWWVMPDVLFSKGGPGALPVVFAAWFYRIPIIIHESDSIPGLTNSFSAKFASKVATSFEKVITYFPNKGVWTGHPIRREMLELAPEEEAKNRLGFKSDVPLIVILGGSQGSQRINEMLVLSLPQVLKFTQVLHQTGTMNIEDVRKLADVQIKDHSTDELRKYEAVPFVENMTLALSAADIVISRASSTLFEIAHFGKPAILIPLKESANDHQRSNAYEYARTGAALVIEEQNLLPAIFANQVKELLTKPEARDRMVQAARNFDKQGGAEEIASQIKALIN